jgi:hypothetical protein
MFKKILLAAVLQAMAGVGMADIVGEWQGFEAGKISRKTGSEQKKLPYFQTYSFQFKPDGSFAINSSDPRVAQVNLTGHWRLRNSTVLASLDSASLADFYRSTWAALGWTVRNVKVLKASFNGEVLNNGAGYVMLLGRQSSNVTVTLAHPAFPSQNIVVREILESTYVANPVNP